MARRQLADRHKPYHTILCKSDEIFTFRDIIHDNLSSDFISYDRWCIVNFLFNFLGKGTALSPLSHRSAQCLPSPRARLLEPDSPDAWTVAKNPGQHRERTKHDRPSHGDTLCTGCPYAGKANGWLDSKVRAARRTSRSSNLAATIWTATGRPAAEKPHGTAAVGCWLRLNG